MERFGGAPKIEKPKLIPVSQDLEEYAELLGKAAVDSQSRINDLQDRAAEALKPLTRHERIHLASYPAEGEAAFAKGKLQPLTMDAIDGEQNRIKELDSYADELRELSNDIEAGRVPGPEGIRAAKEALHLDQAALHEAEERLAVLQRKHDSGEQLSPVHYRVMRELSEEITKRRERVKRMNGRVSMFGEVLHAQEMELGGGARGSRRARIERQSQRLVAKDENGYWNEEDELDHLNPPELPPLTGDEEIAA